MTEYVMQSNRRCGKTYTIMTEIHDLIIQGRRSEILVVCPSLNYVYWWVREWQRRFPHLPMVDYTSMQAMDRVRGKWYSRIFVEDINLSPSEEGMYDEKLNLLRFTARAEDAEIVYTCCPSSLSLRSHSKRASVTELIKARFSILRDPS